MSIVEIFKSKYYLNEDEQCELYLFVKNNKNSIILKDIKERCIFIIKSIPVIDISYEYFIKLSSYRVFLKHIISIC